LLSINTGKGGLKDQFFFLTSKVSGIWPIEL